MARQINPVLKCVTSQRQNHDRERFGPPHACKRRRPALASTKTGTPGPDQPGDAVGPARGYSAACANGRPLSIGSSGSRLHSFQDPKYIRTSFTPACFSATSVLDARAPLKQYR